MKCERKISFLFYNGNDFPCCEKYRKTYPQSAKLLLSNDEIDEDISCPIKWIGL